MEENHWFCLKRTAGNNMSNTKIGRYAELLIRHRPKSQDRAVSQQALDLTFPRFKDRVFSRYHISLLQFRLDTHFITHRVPPTDNLLNFKLDFPAANPNKKLSYACRTRVRQAVSELHIRRRG